MENGNPMIFTGKSCLHLFPHKGYWIFTNMYITDMNKFPPFSVCESSSHKVGLISLTNLG